MVWKKNEVLKKGIYHMIDTFIVIIFPFGTYSILIGWAFGSVNSKWVTDELARPAKEAIEDNDEADSGDELKIDVLRLSWDLLRLYEDVEHKIEELDSDEIGLSSSFVFPLTSNGIDMYEWDFL